MAHVADRLPPPAQPTARAGGIAAAATARLARPSAWVTWAAFLVVVALGAAAPPQRTGDAHQYHAMAAALADLRPPALTAAETAEYKAWLAAQPAASGFPGGIRAVDQPALVRDGRQEFSHFWLYPLLAAPFVAATDLLDRHPADAFLVVNALLLAAALWAIGRWSRPVVGLLLLASPLVWFVDKAQVEVFTFACLALAMVAAGRGRFLWAAAFAAVAATQNLPIAAAVPLFWGAGLLRRRWDRAARGSEHPDGSAIGQGPARRSAPTSWRARTRQGVLVGATVLVVGVHPAYYGWKLGVATPQELNGGIDAGVPSVRRYAAVLIDPNLGLVPWVPLLAVLSVVGLLLLTRPGPAKTGGARRWRELRLATACGLVLGAWFLAAFSQTSNVNSGGTIHLSRYALWLLPLAIPLVEATARRLEPVAPALLPAVGVVAFAGYAVLFRPGQPERYVTPSPQADLLGAWLPGPTRSIPEVFFERTRGVDGGVAGSAANRSCTLLLVTEGTPDPPCPPTAAERAAAARLFGEGWRAVWVVRPGRLGLGGGSVEGAIRP